MLEAASAIKAALLFIVTTSVKYVGQVVAVPALAPCPLFDTISFLMASVLLTLLWIYYGNHGTSCGGCG